MRNPAVSFLKIVHKVEKRGDKVRARRARTLLWGELEVGETPEDEICVRTLQSVFSRLCTKLCEEVTTRVGSPPGGEWSVRTTLVEICE